MWLFIDVQLHDKNLNVYNELIAIDRVCSLLIILIIKQSYLYYL